MSRSKTLLLLLVCLINGSSQAAILRSSYGLIDTATGLEWLKLTITAGQSYNSVASGWGGFVGSGWGFASVDDVATLFTDAGGTVAPSGTDGIYQPTNYEPARTLIGILGATISIVNEGGETFGVRGILGTSNYDRTHQTAYLQTTIFVHGMPSQGLLWADGGGQDYWDWYATPETGSFLVRAASTLSVPEPGTCTLLLIGIGLAVGISRFKRKLA
ncbi:MAG: PEP-CTERM sorting domain-containing protein [Gammaproteobacteria bacterium]|nr:PEP-CTERM sorting domain-containing protein [Gammaproteobacteria bacterium]MBU1602382.1 PEP-CTERM sorting domain-containing protein [Gammaproteobacteria bacterium]MBU2433187.1 PEP-CTERM sorting domain-containing protein [Gammaproteobacteria bacterium]MBU2451103.1 PEP-CTERM sorting domain-containing protein [Gammaproteobacteria bacterium]